MGNEKGIQQPPSLCDIKEEERDYVYAVVHKERKGGASSGASTLKKSSDRPQERTSGLPVNRGSCVDCIGRSLHPTNSGLDNNTEAAESETPQAGGNSEYLYAAFDKTKKEKPPQVVNFTNPDSILLFSFFFLLFIFIKTCFAFNAVQSKEKILIH